MTSRQAINYSKDQHEQILLSLNAQELRRSYQEKLNQIISNSPPPQSPEMSDSGFAEGPGLQTRGQENWAKASPSPRLLSKRSLTAPQVGRLLSRAHVF